MRNDDLIIIDDFYQDPDKIRELALSCEYSTKDSAFFSRSSAFFVEGMRKVFEDIIGVEIPYDTSWINTREVDGSSVSNGHCFNGTFYKRTGEEDRKIANHIHHDCHDWVAIIYLSKDCPEEYGTLMWEHIDTQRSFTSDTYRRCKETKNGFDPIPKNKKDWRVIDDVEYKYNRLLVYNGAKFHSANLPDKDKNIERINQLWSFNEKK